jgi:hypothetical protein
MIEARTGDVRCSPVTHTRLLAAVLVSAMLAACASAEIDPDGGDGTADAMSSVTADAAVVDASIIDAGAADAATADAAAIDASMIDAGAVDASMVDASMIDARPADASMVDAAPPDAPPPDASPPDASPPDASLPDAMPVSQIWRVDTAAEFLAGPPTQVLTSVDLRGAVEPAAYYTGGLLVRASDTGVITDAATTTWQQVLAFPASGKIGLWRSTSQYWEGAAPPGVGLTDGESWTVYAEGEIFLESGAWTFTLEADDHGFVEIAEPSTGAFARVANSDYPTIGSGTFNAPTAGWYPLRWTNADTGGNAGTWLTFRGGGMAAATPIPRERLRVRVDGIVGMAQTGFDDELMVGTSASAIDQGTAAGTPGNSNWGSGRPADLGMTANDDWSVRWSGQFRVDVTGDYVFRYQSDDGQRLFIDGSNRVAIAAWNEGTRDMQTGTIRLDRGWHDLVIDHSDHTGNAASWLTVVAGPELGGQPLPVARMRPVEGRGERFETAVNPGDSAIPDNGTTTSAVALTSTPGATVNFVEISYQFTHARPADLVTTLIPPSGPTHLLRNRTTTPGNTQTLERYLIQTSGAPVAGTWTISVQDAAAGSVGTLLDFTVTAHYAGGGQPPIAPLAIYESPVRDLGAVASIDRVTWDERRPVSTDVVVKMRTCTTAAACATAAWSPPMTEPAGSTPLVTPLRFAQYRVELISGGDASSSLEWIQIDYRAAP